MECTIEFIELAKDCLSIESLLDYIVSVKRDNELTNGTGKVAKVIDANVTKGKVNGRLKRYYISVKIQILN